MHPEDQEELMRVDLANSLAMDELRASLPQLARDYADQLIHTGVEPDAQGWFGQPLWQIEKTNRERHGVSTLTIKMIDDDGQLYELWYTRRRRGPGQRRIRRRLRPLWARPQIVHEWHEALQPSS